MVDVLTSPRRKCNINGATTFIPRDSILTSLVLMHAGYLFCYWHSLNTNYYGTIFGWMPGSFNSSQINVCVMGIGVLGPRFKVSSEGLGLHKMLPPRGFEPCTKNNCVSSFNIQSQLSLVLTRSIQRLQIRLRLRLWPWRIVMDNDGLGTNIRNLLDLG